MIPDGYQAKNVRPIAHTDMDGRPDAVQVVKMGSYLYVGHLWSQGFSVIDVSDPRNPKTVNWIGTPGNTWNTNIQAADDLVLAADEIILFGCHAPNPGFPFRTADYDSPWSSGLRLYDASNPRKIEELAFYPTIGNGTHRNWYVGGRYAHLSARPEGFIDNIYEIMDLKDPRHPEIVGRWWLPGMNEAAGEVSTQKPGERYWLHGPIVEGDRAYCGWWDAGLVILDIADITQPKFISRLDYSPPFGGATHTTLPMPNRQLVVIADEALRDNCEEGEKRMWVVDARAEENPVITSLCPIPGDFREPGSRFGPHNMHENRPGTFISETLVFNAYFRAGLRIFDVTNKERPEEAGFFLPPPPARMVDPRPGKAVAPSSQDVLVDKDGVIYLTDYNCGLWVLEYTG
ncbi:MAG: hypothetical protein IT307_04555 [Chloroflexi bacterium]|nr:hypothetical protein [Chloroflexota bacterium]